MYLPTVSRDSPVTEVMCRLLLPACQRRMTSEMSTLTTSLYAIAALHNEVLQWSLSRRSKCPEYLE